MNDKKLNDFKAMVSSDLVVTDSNVRNKILEVPLLYHKYLGFFIEESRTLANMKSSMDLLYKKVWQELKINSSIDIKMGEMDAVIAADPEYNARRLEYDDQKLMCTYLENVLGRVKQMSFDLKNYVELKIFLAGGK